MESRVGHREHGWFIRYFPNCLRRRVQYWIGYITMESANQTEVEEEILTFFVISLFRFRPWEVVVFHVRGKRVSSKH